MPWCGCIDYPCCGHDADRGPESARDFMDGLDGEELEWAERNMTPCHSCGEMRPQNDTAMQESGGICYMCQQDPVRSQSPVASDNLAYATRALTARNQRLEALLAQHGIEVPQAED